MRCKKIIMAFILMISFLLNINIINAKTLEYTCEYKSIRTYKNQSNYRRETKQYTIKSVNIYSGVDNENEITEVITTDGKNIGSVRNLISDYEYKSNDITKKISKWKKKRLQYNNFECPKYLTNNNNTPNSNHVFVSDNVGKILTDSISLQSTLYENTQKIKHEMEFTDDGEKEITREDVLNNKPETGNICLSNYQYTKKCKYRYTGKNYNTSTYDKSVIVYMGEQSTYINSNGGIGNNAKTGLIVEEPTIGKAHYLNKIKPLNPVECRDTIYYYETNVIDPMADGDIQKKVIYRSSKYNFIASSGYEIAGPLSLISEEDYDKNAICKIDDDITVPIIPGGTEPTCDDLISKDIKDIINKILGYVRIIVPILVIVLGIIDFAQAVFSSKEEEMKKAQARFAKRLIIAVLIFLTPSLINLILDLVNNAWKNGNIFDYSNCGLN